MSRAAKLSSSPFNGSDKSGTQRVLDLVCMVRDPKVGREAFPRCGSQEGSWERKVVGLSLSFRLL